MCSLTDYNNKETTFSTFISIWYVMTCISGEVGSCASRAIDLRFEGATSLSNFEGSTVAIIAERAATVLGKPCVATSLLFLFYFFFLLLPNDLSILFYSQIS